MADLYLDTEFNGHGGQLLSLALVNSSGLSAKHFYERLPDPKTIEPWVKENVFPRFNIEPSDPQEFRWRLREYLQRREPVTIYADWPADFLYLMDAMCGVAFADSFVVECNLVLLRESDPKPEVPHNALSDAHALMKWHEHKISQGNYKSAMATW